MKLFGLEIGKKQEVGVMSVYPLIGDDSKIQFANIEDITFEGTLTYGQMIFKNKSDLPFIIPSGISRISKELAQDHTMPLAMMLRGEETEVFSNCFCIQSTQGGCLSSAPMTETGKIPHFIRKEFLKRKVDVDSKKEVAKLGEYSMSTLWPIIADFQSGLVNDTTEHLVFFFDKYVKQLSNFNAEFEIVPNQRGAIICLNDKVVGIEIAPSHNYWAWTWKSLVRDCYGAEVVRRSILKLTETLQDMRKVSLNLDDCQSIAEILDSIAQYDKTCVENISKEVNTLIDNLSVGINYSYGQRYNKSLKDLVYSIQMDKSKNTFIEKFETEDEVVYMSLIS